MLGSEKFEIGSILAVQLVVEDLDPIQTVALALLGFVGLTVLEIELFDVCVGGGDVGDVVVQGSHEERMYSVISMAFEVDRSL